MFKYLTTHSIHFIFDYVCQTNKPKKNEQQNKQTLKHKTKQQIKKEPKIPNQHPPPPPPSKKLHPQKSPKTKPSNK